MRKLFFTAALIAVAVLCSTPARTQTTGTELAINARWDNGSAVQGVITFSRVNTTGPESVLVTKNLSNGRAFFQTVLAANSVYDVVLTGSNGAQLVKFPVTTVLINPVNLGQAGISLVFNSSNKSLKSAGVNVEMNF